MGYDGTRCDGISRGGCGGCAMRATAMFRRGASVSSGGGDTDVHNERLMKCPEVARLGYCVRAGFSVGGMLSKWMARW